MADRLQCQGFRQLEGCRQIFAGPDANTHACKSYFMSRIISQACRLHPMHKPRVKKKVFLTTRDPLFVNKTWADSCLPHPSNKMQTPYDVTSGACLPSAETGRWHKVLELVTLVSLSSLACKLRVHRSSPVSRGLRRSVACGRMNTFARKWCSLSNCLPNPPSFSSSSTSSIFVSTTTSSRLVWNPEILSGNLIKLF